VDLAFFHEWVGETRWELAAGLPGGRRHGNFSQMWQFEKNNGRGKFVAVRGRNMIVKGPKSLKCGRRKLLYKP
jgi:hypothetical protein